MKELIDLLNAEIPDFVKAVLSQAENPDGERNLIMSQSAFPKLDEKELYLLGAAIKYAGSQGVPVHIGSD
jgi:hypothetical protein